MCPNHKFATRKQPMAQMWMWQTHFMCLICLKLAMLLWWSSCSFCALQHCCGEAPARFVIRNVVVVQLLLVLWFGTLLWWGSCSIYNSQCCFGEAPARFVMFNIAMARRLLTNRNCPVRVPDHLGITSTSPRHHPGITSPQTRETHEVELSSVLQLHSKGFNNFFFELSFC